MKRTLLSLLALITLWPSAALAGDELDDLSLGFGLAGQVMGSFLDQPDDMTVSPDTDIELVYPGFGGVGGGFGLVADLRYMEFLGVETGLFLSADQGSGFIDLVRVSIGQTALHFPLLFKVIYPGESVRPHAALGFELVVPQSLEVSTDPVLSATSTLIGGRASNYGALVTGLGVEFKLPIEGIDLRVPVTVRAAINPGAAGPARDRADYTLDGLTVRSVVFKSEWRYHVSGTVGLSWFLF